MDVSAMNIENLDIDFVGEAKIVEFISRNELDLGRLVNEILMANGCRTEVSRFGRVQ